MLVRGLWEADVLVNVVEDFVPEPHDHGVLEELRHKLVRVVVEDLLVELHSIFSQLEEDPGIAVNGLYLAFTEAVIEQKNHGSYFILCHIFEEKMLLKELPGLYEPAVLAPVVSAFVEAAVFE